MEQQTVNWQSRFAAMLPKLERRFKRAFANLDPSSREEAMQEATLSAMLAYVSLAERGKHKAVRASTLAHYAILHVRQDRPALGGANVAEPLSRYAQNRKGIERRSWIDSIADSKRASVADIVAARLDFRAWLKSLPVKTRTLACELARGATTAECAARRGVTAARISQKRKQLRTSWLAFGNRE